MQFNDMLGLGKVLPLDKLLDVLEKAVGRVTKSYFERKDVDTEVYRIRQLNKANANESVVTCGQSVQLTSSGGTSTLSYTGTTGEQLLDNNIEQRMNNRIDFEEVRRQVNIENIATRTAEELQHDTSTSDTPLAQDWITSFFRIAGDISDETLQHLWARILAGEIREPNSYSVRTLDILKNISKHEAEIFMKVADYAISNDTRSYFLYKGAINRRIVEQSFANYDFDEISLLKEIGLIQPLDQITKELNRVNTETTTPFLFGKQLILVERNISSPTFSIEVYLFSTAGNQLLKLISFDAQNSYINAFINDLPEEGIIIKKADFISYADDYFHFTNVERWPKSK